VEFRQEFEDLGEFVAAYRGKISREGMVLVTDRPYPTGTQLEIEIRLSDSLALVRGKGRVVGPAAGGGRGVTVRLTLLDEQSTDLIDRLERRFVSEGGTPFRLEAPATAPTPSAQEPTLFDIPLQGQSPGGPGRGQARSVATITDPVSRAIAGGGSAPRSSSGAKRTKPRKAKKVKAVEELLPELEEATARPRSAARLALVVGLLVVLGGGLGATFWFVQQRRHAVTGGTPSPAPVAAVETPGEETATTPAAVAAVPDPTNPAAQTPTPGAGPPAPLATLAPQPRQEAAGRATRVERIEWSEQDGATVVTISADGPLSQERARQMRLEDPPRVVVRLLDIRHAYSSLTLEVGGPRLQRIRTWHHAEQSPPELHVVLDLTGASVVQRELSVSGSRLQITLGTGP